jgi:hypothetical protein
MMKTLCSIILLVALLPQDEIFAFVFTQRVTIITLVKSKSPLFAKRNKTFVSVKELVEVMKTDSEKLFQNSKRERAVKTSKRTRKRVEDPKQKYLYAAQKKALVKSSETAKTNGESQDDGENEKPNLKPTLDKNSPITISRNLGINPSLQSCEASYAAVAGDEPFYQVVPTEEPRIIQCIKLGGAENDGISGMYAYVIDKPVGWSILESNSKKRVSASLTPTENENLKEATPDLKEDKGKRTTSYYDEERDEFDAIEYEPLKMLSVMTPEEIEEFEREGGFEGKNLSDMGARIAKKAIKAVSKYDEEKDIETLVKKTEDKLLEGDNYKPLSKESAVFASESRPSIVKWLKDLKCQEGTPIRGGKFWVAVAGAVEIDDSGLLVLCPKDKVDQFHIDYTTYTAVLGNGKFFAPKGKKKSPKNGKVASHNDAKVDIVSKLKKGRDEDVVLTVKITVPDGFSTTNDVVQICQKQFSDGIRGDSEANPLDRRGPRRLLHCCSVAISSLSYDDSFEGNIEIPDDIRIFSDRRNHHEYTSGSFLGRNSLRNNPYTTAYREINGDADGFPGWIVDRYDKWLFVQHNAEYEQGPLPSIHAGHTAGVYYFPTERDRSVTGGKKGIKPVLLEGKAAPDILPIKENGITYHVNFDDLSTGIFLDQRHQRAWLSRFCTKHTKVLNCFSHCGAFSIAAATAGARTVSLDLDRKWLDRIQPQLTANGIDNSDMKHDTIFGDCEFLVSCHHFIAKLLDSLHCY